MDILAQLIMPLINWIKENYKKPKLWIIAVILIVFVFWLIPYIDSNFFYYDRMEKRVSILQQLTELDQQKISSNAVLQNEYEDILNDIEVQEERMVSSIITNISNSIIDVLKVEPQESSVLLKFLSGAALCLILAFLMFFMNTFPSRKEKISSIVMFIFLAFILGIIGANIPTFIHPNVNYWGMPFIQLIGLIILAVKFGKTDDEKKGD